MKITPPVGWICEHKISSRFYPCITRRVTRDEESFSLILFFPLLSFPLPLPRYPLSHLTSLADRHDKLNFHFLEKTSWLFTVCVLCDLSYSAIFYFISYGRMMRETSGSKCKPSSKTHIYMQTFRAPRLPVSSPSFVLALPPNSRRLWCYPMVCDTQGKY